VETGSRQENESNQESRAPFRFYRNGKGWRDDFSLNRHPALSFCLSRISGQTLRVCPEGKPVPTLGSSPRACFSGRCSRPPFPDEKLRMGGCAIEPGLTQVRQNHGLGRQQPARMCRFSDVSARFSGVPLHIIVRADAYPGVTRMVVERHVRLNSPQCEPFQYEPHRHERRPQIAAAFLLHRILVQTAERVDQGQNGKRDTDQPQQQITSHESASGLRAD
jgi:hypothetical protein